jgi:ferredoxin
MKVVVDFGLCGSHGLCVDSAPDVFELSDNGTLKILNETPDESLRAKVDRAARECPTGAITVEG